MCGIAGFYNRSGSPVTEGREIISRMNALLSHRGPDDDGFWSSRDGSCFLGHKRLSIIDLSPRGRQPMGNEDGTVWISY
ncbi:MAG: asparagine synthetase B, partial [Candidatus Aminicenantaceae bacterium]